MNYEQKYLKYKAKYVQAKQEGGLGGHLRVFFLTDEEFFAIHSANQNIGNKLQNKKAIKSVKEDYTNIAYPGLAIHSKTNNSGFEKKFPFINEHEQKVHYNGMKIPFANKAKFDYYDMKDLNQAVQLISISAQKSDLSKIILVRDYTALHDVFVASFTLVKEGEKVTGITIDPIGPKQSVAPAATA
jgi:hypothetical protein